jgi:hypothetical protein
VLIWRAGLRSAKGDEIERKTVMWFFFGEEGLFGYWEV